ncbi:MAG: squalene--hopene cyclase [Candidatus Competibacteraceae bacterium]|nr:squalene--hopene cyclase [Candidatus Competibacteraceae bacterium]
MRSSVAAEATGEHAVRALDAATDPVTSALTRSAQALLTRQSAQGFWHFDLEADATIPAEYLFLQYFLGRVDNAREQRIAQYLLRTQNASGSWSLYDAGPGDISATVKAYFALKLAGQAAESEPMLRARTWVLANGGAEKVNVFTRITLALFGQLSWRTVPAMPVEIMLLPKWWFFNMSRVSYWSRCVIVPLLMIFAVRPIHRFRPEQGVAELFHCRHPLDLHTLDPICRPLLSLKNLFTVLDRVIRLLQPAIPVWIRNRAMQNAEAWVRDHMQGSGGIGAIYPAMANAVMALKVTGASDDDPDLVRTLQAIEDLVLDGMDETYVQPCLSPVWDTCLSLTALTESGAPPDSPAVQRAVEWLFDNQIFSSGDWAQNVRSVEPGGWCFQFENEKYPDVDDTGMVLLSLFRAGAHQKPERRMRLTKAVNWLLGMQNTDGSWGAFDVGNDAEYLNKIPFADHGALVDPGTADLTARCIEVLAMLGYDASYPPLARALAFLQADQLDNGAWYGRWGVNYIYGTWSVLSAVGMLAGEDRQKPYIRKAASWLRSVQNADGGWGESCGSYDDPALMGRGDSTPSQTAWALLGLMAVDPEPDDVIRRGIDYLLDTQNAAGEWDETAYTGTGFPRVFYLRYHGYARYFPLWALATYARQRRGMPTRQEIVRTPGKIEIGPLADNAAA